MCRVSEIGFSSDGGPIGEIAEQGSIGIAEQASPLAGWRR
jgi:hypothetical protein